MISRSATVYTVINEDYLPLAQLWAGTVRRVCDNEIVFGCTDRAAADALAGSGHTVLPLYAERDTAAGPDDPARDRAEVYHGSIFPNDHAAHTVFQKFGVALRLIAEGKDCVYSDVDALWLASPFDDLSALDADVAFQPGVYPQDIADTVGFTACTGFFACAANDRAAALLRAASKGRESDDQFVFNRTLATEYDIAWGRAPADWQHPRREGGWVEPVLGKDAATGLKLAALPHACYQRIGMTRHALGHAIIAHPVAPRRVEGKIAVFQELGLPPGHWPLPVRARIALRGAYHAARARVRHAIGRG